MLAVVIEAMTVTSLKEFDATNRAIEQLGSKSKAYAPNVSYAEIDYSEKATKELKHLLTTNRSETFKHISNEQFVQTVYQKNNYMPLWFTSKGAKHHALEDFFKTIGSDPMLDTSGAIYKRYSYLKSTLQGDNNRSLSKELMLDIQLTSLYEKYLNFHIYGSIKWWQFQKTLSRLRKRKISANWVTYEPKYDIASLMLHYPLSKIVQATTPSSFGYPQMLQELKRLKSIKEQGGWSKIPNSKQLRYGHSGEHVRLLIERLRSSGDYTCPVSNEDNTFGPCLQQALKRFQKRHGLYPSGKFNSYTRKKMNISVEWKIKKVLLNLDRIKRLPDQDESRYLMINIPDFRLYYRENGQEIFSTRVIVGDKENRTPIFSDEISFIVLNPYWIMPDSIVKNEIIPEILKNPNFLAERGYEVRTSYNTKAAPIDTTKIDWAEVLRTDQTKKYKFMQPPGPKNALGKIKFKFPNRFAVYLHDTPNKKLFKKGQRAFSHGCIRVAEPQRLLAQFARHEQSFSYNRTQRILQGRNKTQLNLSQRVPIHIVYLTAWVDSDGLLHYRNDIYNYDTKQPRAIY